MSGYLLKHPDRIATLLMDWRRGHLAAGEAVVRDLGWSIQPNEPTDAGVRVVDQGHDASRSWATFAGGAPGRVYMVVNRVRTSDERVLARAIVLRIALGAGPQ